MYTIEVPFDTEADFVLSHEARVTRINEENRPPLKKGEPVYLKKGIYKIYVE